MFNMVMRVTAHGVESAQKRKTSILLLLFSAAIVFISFQRQGHIGFSLWDEGFLWYGAQRVMLGEVPIRDFMAYDFGRYYWSAALMSLMRDSGIIALRMSVAVFQVIGLFLALFLLVRTWKCAKPIKVLLVLLATGIFMLWMFPRHKLFDITLAITLIAVLAYLIASPTIRRYFLTGIIIGIVAIFGRNHGVYGVIGSLTAIAYLTWGQQTGGTTFFMALKWWILGVVIGYLPMLLALVLVPGLAESFVESIRFLFESKATNLPLPVPWPWLVQFSTSSLLVVVRNLLIGVFFIAVLAFGVIGIVAMLYTRKLPPVLLASLCMALPYAHYAFSRADVGHLAQGIFPFLIGMLALTAEKSNKVKVSVAALLLIASYLVMIPLHPEWGASRGAAWQDIQILGDQLKVTTQTANDLSLLKSLVDEYATQGRPFLITPFWPGAYAVFERKSPIWEIYALVPRNAKFQQAEVNRIKNTDPGFVVVFDYALDGREELRFRNTHAIIDQYIRQNFELIAYPQAPEAFEIYKRIIE